MTISIGLIVTILFYVTVSMYLRMGLVRDGSVGKGICYKPNYLRVTLGPTWWKQRTSYDLCMYAVACAYQYAPPPQKKINKCNKNVS